jgi:hypothetical protein
MPAESSILPQCEELLSHIPRFKRRESEPWYFRFLKHFRQQRLQVDVPVQVPPVGAQLDTREDRLLGA